MGHPLPFSRKDCELIPLMDDEELREDYAEKMKNREAAKRKKHDTIQVDAENKKSKQADELKQLKHEAARLNRLVHQSELGDEDKLCEKKEEATESVRI